MNIFKDTKNFIGEFHEESNTVTVREVLLTANRIRVRLGKKSYLLDTYLSLFFASINNTAVYDSADFGFQLTCDLRSLCISVLDKTDTHKDHLLYEKALEVLNSRKSIFEFQERHTQYSLLFLALADDFLTLIVPDYIQKERRNLHCVLDIVRFQNLYSDISAFVSEDEMDHLNQLLKEKFMVSSMLSAFIQGFNDELIDIILTIDIETNKKMFQIEFDDLFPISENN